jgi:hypothetical protein
MKTITDHWATIFCQKLHLPVMEYCESNVNELKRNRYKRPAVVMTTYSCCLIYCHSYAGEHCVIHEDKALELMASPSQMVSWEKAF